MKPYGKARLRFRPVMMTATVAAFGLVPFLFATGPGSEIQRPLAIVVIGGLVSSTALTLLLVPVVYGFFEGKGGPNLEDEESAAPPNISDLDLQPVRTSV
jgi:heavy metal efflux system protein